MIHFINHIICKARKGLLYSVLVQRKLDTGNSKGSTRSFYWSELMSFVKEGIFDNKERDQATTNTEELYKLSSVEPVM